MAPQPGDADQFSRSLFDYYKSRLSQDSTGTGLRLPMTPFSPFKSPPERPSPHSQSLPSYIGIKSRVTLDENLCKDCSNVVRHLVKDAGTSLQWQLSEPDSSARVLHLSRTDADDPTPCRLCAWKREQLEGPSSEGLKLFAKQVSQPQHRSLDGDIHEADIFSKPFGRGLPQLAHEDFSSEQSLQQARAWVTDCISKHTSCNITKPLLPKRVLSLRHLAQTKKVFLHLSHLNETGSYATVSYTWGPTGSPRLKTKEHDPSRPDLRIASHQAGIEIGRFPQTLQDAIYIAQNLNFEYLWIDSVCIIQDDKMDWITQSAAMTQIYARARLNISASSSKDSAWGIFGQSLACGVRVGLLTLTNEDGGRCQDQDLYVGFSLPVVDLEDKFLSTRGWVFQERLVSPATIHYTDEGMVWECIEGIKMAQSQNYHTVEWKKQWRDAVNAPTVSTATGASVPGDQLQRIAATTIDKVLSSWKEWVSAYSERQLYDNGDRFHAMAGIAKTISQTFQLTYAAGLWQQDLVGGLLWKRFNRTETLMRHAGDPTPSWSWASVQGRLVYLDIQVMESYKGPNLVVLGPAEVQEVRPGTYGPVHGGGKLRVKGMLQEVVVEKKLHPGQRERAYEEVGVKAGFSSAVNVLVTLDSPNVQLQEDYRCWCLRVGSFDDGGREADVFLLLERIEGAGAMQVGIDTFRRVGLVETAAWHNSLSVVPESGKLIAAKETELTLV